MDLPQTLRVTHVKIFLKYRSASSNTQDFKNNGNYYEYQLWSLTLKSNNANFENEIPTNEIHSNFLGPFKRTVAISGLNCNNIQIYNKNSTIDA